MIEDILDDAKSRMGKSADSLSQELARIRTGRASTALLDGLTVDYYGTPTPINQVAAVSVSDARTLSVVPWEKQMVPLIEKAIMESELGLNPVTAGENIRIPIPPLTEERRRDMVKIVKHEGENAKVAVRNIRRDAIQHIKELHREKEITEDDVRRSEERVQKLTDSYVAKIDEIVAGKEKELMEI